MAQEKPQHPIEKDSIPGDEEKQRAWREAKLRELVENQTPSEIMEAMTGNAVEKFTIDGIDVAAADGETRTHSLKSETKHTPIDIDQLAATIKEEVFLLESEGLVLTKRQLATQLGINPRAIDDMTSEGIRRLGLIKITPISKRERRTDI